MLPFPPVRTAPRPRATATGIGFATQSPLRATITRVERRENNRLTGTDRRNVVLNAESLAHNSPYVEGALMNAADYRGPLTPYPATSDPEWNKLAAPVIQRTLIDDPAWDASGRFSFAALQRLMWIYHDLAGDCFAVHTHLEPENPLSRPVTRIIPSLMCDSPGRPGMFNAEGWIDGVQVGPHHRARRYHFLYEEDTVKYASLTNNAGFYAQPENVFHFARFPSIGSTRGLTRFITTGNLVVEAGMRDSAVRSIFKLAAKLHAQINQDKDTAPPPLKPATPAVFTSENTTSQATENPDNAEDADDPQRIGVETLAEQLAGPGAALVDFSDRPGTKIHLETLAGTLPDLSDSRASDLELFAMVWGLPVQVILCIFSGVFNVTGPGFRISLARGSRWRTEELRKPRPWVIRTYQRHVSWLLQTRQLPYPKKSLLDPLACAIRQEPDLTIDEQRDVKNDNERLAQGVTSEMELASFYGRPFHEVLAERTEAINAICDALPPDRRPYWGGAFAIKEKEKDPAAENAKPKSS